MNFTIIIYATVGFFVGAVIMGIGVIAWQRKKFEEIMKRKKNRDR